MIVITGDDQGREDYYCNNRPCGSRPRSHVFKVEIIEIYLVKLF